MTTDIQKLEKLEKLVKEQAKQIDSLKKAMSGLQRYAQIMSKKIDRTYHSGRKSTGDIMKLNAILGKNR